MKTVCQQIIFGLKRDEEVADFLEGFDFVNSSAPELNACISVQKTRI
jgi:hypothetical protein